MSTRTIKTPTAPEQSSKQPWNECVLSVPFNRVSLAGSEFRYMQEALALLVHISGDGAFTQKCQSWLEQRLGVHRALLTTSCTHALEMSGLLLDPAPGDEVIVPSFTFPSTVNAFVLLGAVPVFADIRRDTCNIDENQIERLITPKTRAIVVVHYAGVGCEMDQIMKIAGEHGLMVIEDNAHGLFGRYRGRYLGTFGTLATQSFHETKNITCGEGGALLLNDEELAERAEIIRQKGTNRARFFRGQVDKYSWVDIGSSYLPSELLAGFLYAQFEEADSIQEQRKAVWQRYWDALQPFADRAGWGFPFIPKHCEQAYHMFYLLLPSLELRQALIAHLRSRDIGSAFHYIPLHSSAAGVKYGKAGAQCPVTDDISARLLRLPFFAGLTVEQQSWVIGSIEEFCKSHA